MLGKNVTKTSLVWLLLLLGLQIVSIQFIVYFESLNFILPFWQSNSEFIHPCTQHNGISEELAYEVLKDWPGNLNLASVNRTHKCFVTCILLYYNIVTTSGDLSLDKYYNAGDIDPRAIAPTIRRCFYEYRQETDYCEHTFGLFNCFRQEQLIKTHGTFNKWKSLLLIYSNHSKDITVLYTLQKVY